MYTKFEEQYINALKNIEDNGIVCVSGRQTNDEVVTRTKRVWGTQFNIDLQKEFPVLRSKHVAVYTAIREILWIMQKQSNNIKDLRGAIWDQWADENGCIGTTYGYNVAKPVRTKSYVYHDQVRYVLGLLEKDPSSRHGVIDIWDGTTIATQNCVPCCFASHWAILDGKLNVCVIQRSADMMIGLPFNVAQYAFLALAFARHLGVEPGMYIHQITDAHIYENQYGTFDDGGVRSDAFQEQMDNWMKIVSGCFHGNVLPYVEFPEDTDFFALTDDNFKVHNYKAPEFCFEDIKYDVTK